MENMRHNRKKLVIFLTGIIIILALILAYIFILRPSLNGYAINLQKQGSLYTLNAVLSQVQQNGYVQIPVGNQTLTLIPPQLCSQFASYLNSTSANK
ncbi:MAG TPA: hypothetical protein VMC07_00435 [Candidatus Omnitrophota bacterium]|nr:hypothetical protein [Candidatus Omnitrophota bacterium]